MEVVFVRFLMIVSSLFGLGLGVSEVVERCVVVFVYMIICRNMCVLLFVICWFIMVFFCYDVWLMINIYYRWLDFFFILCI